MAFFDDLARDPKSEKECWQIIEDTVVQVKAVLADYPVETPEEALAGTLRRGNFKDTAVSIIRPSAVGDTSQCIAASETPAASHQPRLAAARPCVNPAELSERHTENPRSQTLTRNALDLC
jgi:hypothetical protein